MWLVGERKACAAVVLSFFGSLFLLNAILGPDPPAPMFGALALAYLAGFFGLVAGWFWSRWYCLGLGVSGLIMAAMMAWQVGAEPFVLIWGGAHLVVALSLVGKGPASLFDGRKDWRERYRMDENGANRLGKSIMRAGASIPYLILGGLAPREDGLVLPLVALLIGAAGLWAVVRLRTWGLVAMAAAAITASFAALGSSWGGLPALAVPAGIMFLAGAVLPFAAPMWRALR
ncbi:MAG: hypothetical protein HY698_10680 [Deltaproteobacteria bacterium]|nr:hypothetical protein [Deltaproteobacteria bacterium]